MATTTLTGRLRAQGRQAAAQLQPRDVLGAAACAAPVGAGLVLAFRAGGYFVPSWGTAEIALLGALAIVALWLPRPGRLGCVALVGWIAFAGWEWSTSAWADEPSAAMAAMHRSLLYGSAFSLALLGLRRAAWLPRLTEALTAVVGAVAVYAAAARLFPSLVSGDREVRLSAPITYWNGLAALLAFGSVLAVAVAGDAARPRAIRALAGAVVPLFLLDLLLTFSRGGAIALAFGVGLLLLLAPGRLESLTALFVTGAIAAPLLVFANGEPRVARISGAVTASGKEGRHVALFLVGCMLAAGVAVPLATSVVARTPDARRRLAGGVVSVAIVLVAAVLLATHWPRGGPTAFAHRQLDAFRTYDPGARANSKSLSDRLTVAAGSGRWQNWQVAVREFRSAPLAGAGAGDYRFWWNERRPIEQSVVNAHSLYLETLADSGVVGLALLLVAPFVVLFAVVRRRSQLSSRLRRESAVALAAGAAVAVHLGVDWDWQLPAVVLPAVVLGGAVLGVVTRSPAGDTPRARMAWAWLPATLCLLAAVAAVGLVASASRLDEGKRLAAAGHLQAALTEAQRAARLDPSAAQPRLLEAYVLSDLGRGKAADEAFAAALERAPRDWSIAADWAAALLRRGDTAAARPLIARARLLNPREPRVALLEQAAGIR